MKTRHIAFAAIMLALVFLLHAASRFTQIGGAQIAPSVAIYTLLAALLAPELNFVALFGIGLVAGILMMLATASPFPPLNFGHTLGFLVAAYIVKGWIKTRPATVLQLIATAAAAVVVSWTAAAIIEWIGLANTSFVAKNFNRFNINFGHGLFAWWLYGIVIIAIPTFIVAAILTPLLYRVVRPAMIRQGMISESATPLELDSSEPAV